MLGTIDVVNCIVALFIKQGVSVEQRNVKLVMLLRMNTTLLWTVTCNLYSMIQSFDTAHCLTIQHNTKQYNGIQCHNMLCNAKQKNAWPVQLFCIFIDCKQNSRKISGPLKNDESISSLTFIASRCSH